MPSCLCQVVVFLNEQERNNFMENLMDFVGRYELVDLVTFEIGESDLFSLATTKEKRNAMLEKFFKTIFKEVAYRSISIDTRDVCFVLSAALSFVNYISRIVKTGMRGNFQSYPITSRKIVLTSSDVWLFDVIKNVMPSTVPEKH